MTSKLKKFVSKLRNPSLEPEPEEPEYKGFGQHPPPPIRPRLSPSRRSLSLPPGTPIPTPAVSKSLFFRLPAEIRRDIYDLIFPKSRVHLDYYHNVPYDPVLDEEYIWEHGSESVRPVPVRDRLLKLDSAKIRWRWNARVCKAVYNTNDVKSGNFLGYVPGVTNLTCFEKIYIPSEIMPPLKGERLAFNREMFRAGFWSWFARNGMCAHRWPRGSGQLSLTGCVHEVPFGERGLAWLMTCRQAYTETIPHLYGRQFLLSRIRMAGREPNKDPDINSKPYQLIHILPSVIPKSSLSNITSLNFPWIMNQTRDAANVWTDFAHLFEHTLPEYFPNLQYITVEVNYRYRDDLRPNQIDERGQEYSYYSPFPEFMIPYHPEMGATYVLMGRESLMDALLGPIDEYVGRADSLLQSAIIIVYDIFWNLICHPRAQSMSMFQPILVEDRIAEESLKPEDVYYGTVFKDVETWRESMDRRRRWNYVHELYRTIPIEVGGQRNEENQRLGGYLIVNGANRPGEFLFRSGLLAGDLPYSGPG